MAPAHSKSMAQPESATPATGNIYATLLDWNGGPITLKELKAGGATMGKVFKVELLGSDVALAFVQDVQGLTVTPSAPAQPLPGIASQPLASSSRVLRITRTSAGSTMTIST